MLTIILKDREAYDEKSGEFRTIKGGKIELEHSLISISKWESKWKKPFMNSEKTEAEILDYIKCMSISKDIDDSQVACLTNSQLEQIKAYMEDTMTATWFSDTQKQGAPKRANREIVTSELIYYWMISQNVPIEFQKWHINRLMTLIRVCMLKNSDDKSNKMPRKEIYKQNQALNAARRAKLGSKG